MNKIHPTLCMFLALLAALVVGPSSSADPAVMEGFPPSAESQVTKANYLIAPFNRWAFRNAGAPLHGGGSARQLSRVGRRKENV